MSRLQRILVAACAALALSVCGLAASSAAAANNPVITDCYNHGKLTNNYTLAQLRHARATLPSTVKEYTNCYDVISQAIVSALKTGTYTGGSGKSSGGSFLPVPVIIILVLLILVAITFGVVAIRRRSGGPPAGSGGSGGPPAGSGGSGGPPAGGGGSS